MDIAQHEEITVARPVLVQNEQPVPDWVPMIIGGVNQQAPAVANSRWVNTALPHQQAKARIVNLAAQVNGGVQIYTGL